MERELQILLFDRVFQRKHVFLWCKEKNPNPFHPSIQIWWAASDPTNIADV